VVERNRAVEAADLLAVHKTFVRKALGPKGFSLVRYKAMVDGFNLSQGVRGGIKYRIVTEDAAKEVISAEAPEAPEEMPSEAATEEFA
jgi:hypothetical protein